MDPAVPELIAGRYRIERQLGRGGFATTWLAHDLKTGRDVAAKVLDIKALDHWKSVELFEREARVLERLDHPRIPRYLDFVAPAESGPDAARMVLVQERAPGEPLSDRLAAGWRPTEPEVLAIARQVLDILIWLQAQSPPVVHRDIKPANLVMDGEGVVRLVDFGAVRDTVASQSRFGSTIVGSFGYMAPEQFQGDARPESDLYGLGATLVALLTGKEPADLGHERMRLDFHAHVSVAEPVRDWLDRLLDPVADERFASAAVSLAALDAPAGSAGAPQSIRRQRAELWVEDAEFRVVVHSNMRVHRLVHHLQPVLVRAGCTDAPARLLAARRRARGVPVVRAGPADRRRRVG
jgi:serine/threonine protein kinase